QQLLASVILLERHTCTHDSPLDQHRPSFPRPGWDNPGTCPIFVPTSPFVAAVRILHLNRMPQSVSVLSFMHRVGQRRGLYDHPTHKAMSASSWYSVVLRRVLARFVRNKPKDEHALCVVEPDVVSRLDSEIPIKRPLKRRRFSSDNETPIWSRFAFHIYWAGPFNQFILVDEDLYTYSPRYAFRLARRRILRRDFSQGASFDKVGYVLRF